MNWYKLEKVRATLRSRYGCELAPSGIGHDSNLEVWQRSVAGEVHRSFLSYDGADLLVPEEGLIAALEALAIPPREFLEALRAAGGLYLGPGPA